jgi:CheY-like chemotaxis protein
MKKILLVEDNAVVARALRAFLGRDYDVYWAPGPLEAHRIFSNGGFDLAILDYDLGYNTANGIQTCRTLKTLQPSLPAILYTGMDPEELREALQVRYCPDRVVVKGDVKCLLEQISQLIG